MKEIIYGLIIVIIIILVICVCRHQQVYHSLSKFTENLNTERLYTNHSPVYNNRKSSMEHYSAGSFERDVGCKLVVEAKQYTMGTYKDKDINGFYKIEKVMDCDGVVRTFDQATEDGNVYYRVHIPRWIKKHYSAQTENLDPNITDEYPEVEFIMRKYYHDPAYVFYYIPYDDYLSPDCTPEGKPFIFENMIYKLKHKIHGDDILYENPDNNSDLYSFRPELTPKVPGCLSMGTPCPYNERKDTCSENS